MLRDHPAPASFLSAGCQSQVCLSHPLSHSIAPWGCDASDPSPRWLMSPSMARVPIAMAPEKLWQPILPPAGLGAAGARHHSQVGC